jgi:hypothetical protein
MQAVSKDGTKDVDGTVSLPNDRYGEKNRKKRKLATIKKPVYGIGVRTLRNGSKQVQTKAI